ncbi:MAG TPA: acyl-CoA dehydrogenase family protein, partial [Pseudonocardiaceae bacterium]
MDFAFSEEQDLLRASAREFLEERQPLEGVAEIVDADEPGWPEEVWKQLAELGWLDAELELLDHVVVIEETGYGLLPAPLFSTLALALAAVEDDEQLREAVAAGDLRLTLAWAEAGRPQELGAATSGITVDAGGRVSGTAALVPDAGWVDAFVVVTADGPRLVRAADATVTPRATSDRTRRLSDVTFEDAP